MPNIPRISPGATQMLLPFMEKLGLSPKGEQPIQAMKSLMELTEAQAPQATPWQRLIQNVPKYSDETLRLKPADVYKNWPRELQFEIQKPGVSGSVGGAISAKGEPKTSAYTEYLRSTGTRRTDIGAPDTGLEHYSMDISSPAQRQLPLRGQKLSQAGDDALTHRVPRTAEERVKEVYKPTTGMTMGDRQQSIDKLMRLLRDSGFKELTFSAEAGERPRLYEMLTGYKAKPEGGYTIDRMAQQMGVSPAQDPAYAWMQRLTPSHALDEMGIEQALGMSVHDAVASGMATQRGGGSYSLTDQGIQNLTNWLTGGR